jgi:glycerophosphoryl diester phosphodiesterase
VNGWLLIAHRGASADATENTIAAFDLAKRQGADAVECDVRLTRDGTPVVFHDADLRRLGGRPERIDALSDGALAAVRVGDGERIPTLAEALDWSSRGLPLVIEVKAGAELARVARQVAAAIRRAPAAQILDVSSFSAPLLSALAAQLPGVPRALVAEEDAAEAAAVARSLNVEALHLAVERWPGHPPFAPTLVWTVDDPVQARRLLDEGATGIFTNRPGRLAPLRAAA